MSQIVVQPDDERRRGPDVAAREGPAPLVHVRQRHDPRSQAGLRQVAPADGARRRAHPSTSPTGPDRARQRERSDVGRRSRLRPRPPPAAHRAPQAGHRTPAPRPGHADHRRSVRPHPTVVAVRDRRRAEGQPGRAHREAAPHDHRRRRWRPAVARVPRLRTRGPGSADPDAGRDRPGERGERPGSAGLDARLRGRHAAHPARHRPADQGPAGRPRPDPRCQFRGSRHVPRDRQPARRHREGTIAAVDRALAAPPPRGRQRTVHGDACRGPQAGRHAEHGVHDGGQPKRPPRYHTELGAPVESLRASMAISTRTDDSGANAFSLVRMLVPTGDIPIDERFRAIHEVEPGGGRASRRAPTSRPSPPSRRRCPPRSSRGSPASRRRRSTSRRRT